MRIRILALALAGCVGNGDRVEVTDTNDLGVTMLSVDREGGVFVLRGLASDGTELASVRRTTGTIPDLARVLPGGNDQGSELVLRVGDTTWRARTRETTHLRVRTDNVEASIHQFLAIAQVPPLLANADILVLQPAGTERAYGPQAEALACNPDHLNTSPVAGQCCEQWDFYDYEWTMAIRAADSNLVIRYANPYHLGCKAEDGVSDCDGTSCYYGPNGFSKADVVDTYGGEYAHIYAALDGEFGGTECRYSAAPSNDFGDVTGNFPTGQSCPGGNGGGSPDWDY